MDIGLFCDTYPLELDGVGMVVRSYAERLRGMGHRCCMVVPEAGRGFKENAAPCKLLQYHGVALPMMRQYRAGIPYFDFSYLSKRRGVKMDLLHAHSPFGSGMEAVRLSRILGIPLIGTFHSKYYDDFYNVTKSETLSHAGVKLILGFFRACDEVWTVNASTKRVLRAYGYTGDIIIMPNGSNTTQPTPEDAARARSVYAIRQDVPVFLFVGQQHRKKNIYHVLEALKLLKLDGRDFQMLMIGQGPHAEEIRTYARDSGIESNCVFTGQVMDRALLSGIYAASDLLLFPSLYDTAGLVVQEAASAKTPAMVVRGSCAAECVTDGVNGFLCQNNPHDIKTRILSIMDTPGLLSRVGEEARRTIPIPWSEVLYMVEKRYEALLSRYSVRAMRIRALNGTITRRRR